MASDILDRIGTYIKDNNTYFNSFTVNGTQLPDGRVIQFTDGKEKRFIGISDNFGTAGYIRSNPRITVPTSARRISSGVNHSGYLKQCRLVAYSWNDELTSEALMTKLVTDIRNINFTGNTRVPVITIKNTNHNYLDIIKDEFLKEPNEVGGYGFVCVAIDFDLQYWSEECSICEISGDRVPMRSDTTRWGEIEGDIEDQYDLIALINSITPIWGSITGDIEDQTDLIELITGMAPNVGANRVAVGDSVNGLVTGTDRFTFTTDAGAAEMFMYPVGSTKNLRFHVAAGGLSHLISTNGSGFKITSDSSLEYAATSHLFSGGTVQIGAGTTSYSPKVSVIANQDSFSYQTIENQSIGSLSSAGLIIGRTAFDYTWIARYSSTYIGIFNGTSISASDVSHINNSTDGSNGSAPIAINGSVLYGLIGTTATNSAIKIDAIGLRIDSAANIHTANTVLFQAKDLTWADTALNRQFTLNGLFNGYVQWTSNASADTFVVSGTGYFQSRGSQVPDAGVFHVNRIGESGLVARDHLVFQSTHGFGNAPLGYGIETRYDLSGSVPLSLITGVGKTGLVWENNVTDTTTTRNSAFVIKTMAGGVLAERLRVGSVLTTVTGGFSVSGLSGVGNRLTQSSSNGAQSATLSVDEPMYLDPVIHAVQIAKLIIAGNWTAGNYTGGVSGAITGTYQGQRYANTTHLFEAQADNTWARTVKA